MNCVVLLVCLAMNQTPAAAAAVEVVTLSEKQIQGTIESLSSDNVVVKTSNSSLQIPLSDVLTLRLTSPAVQEAADARFLVRLTDDSRLLVSSFLSTGTNVTVSHPVFGELQLPVTTVSNVRFAPPDPKIDLEWSQLLERSVKKDMVAVRKGDVLDHLDGIVGSLSDSTLQFQLDGDDLPVKRDKVFGLIFSKRDSTTKKTVARIDLVTGDRLSARQVDWDGKKWQVRLVNGAEVEVAPEQLLSLDFSQSKLTYLSDLEPREVKHTPYFNYPGVLIWKYKKDSSFEGKPITLDKTEYRKGLALHSLTQMRFRLGGEYRRFQAVMGIGDEINYGDANVIIKADERIVFSGNAKTSNSSGPNATERPKPQRLDIDVMGVVELEIFVGYGSENEATTDIGDRVYFGNARLLR